MDKNINAEWVRKTSREILGEKVKKEIEKCEAIIISAVKSNKNSVNIYINLDKLTIKEFEDRGFTVSKFKSSPDPRDMGSGHRTISW